MIRFNNNHFPFPYKITLNDFSSIWQGDLNIPEMAGVNHSLIHIKSHHHED